MANSQSPITIMQYMREAAIPDLLAETVNDKNALERYRAHMKEIKAQYVIGGWLQNEALDRAVSTELEINRRAIGQVSIREARDTALERYFVLMHEARKFFQGLFNLDEWALLADVVPAQRWGFDTASYLEYDTADMLGEDCDIEGTVEHSLVTKMSILSLTERLALVDVLERLWRSTVEESFEEMLSRLGVQVAPVLPAS